MNRIIYVLLALIFITCKQENSSKYSITQFIPRKAGVIIKTENLSVLRTSLKNNEAIERFSNTSYPSFFKESKALFDAIPPKQKTLLCYTKIGKDSYELTLITKAFKTSSIDTTAFNIKSLTGTTPPILEVSNENDTFYTLHIDDTFLVSSSQLLLENTLREKDTENIAHDTQFNKVYQAASSSADASIILKGSELPVFWQDVLPKASQKVLTNKSSWSLIDLNLSKQSIELDGVVLSSEIDDHLQLLKNTQPSENNIESVTPLAANGAISMTFTDWVQYKNNLATFRKLDPVKFNIKQEVLLSTFQEVGQIFLKEGTIIAASGIDPTLTDDALASYNTPLNTFRQVPIFEYDQEDAFAKAYTPLLEFPTVKFYCRLGDFYLFAENQSLLETVIANFQNKATLAESASYQNTKSQLSDAASLLLIGNTSQLPIEEQVSEKEASEVSKINFEGFPYAALQLIQDSNFLHLRGVFNKNEAPASNNAIVQVASIKLDKAIASPPQLVKNHRTKGMDIVVQDDSNELYLISNAGKILWQKPLDSKIIGTIDQVDLYRNGRLQLAFTTANKFYIIDRNGNDVAPFPLNFSSEITQPVSIFDYENNRNYRFVITQSDQVTIYDKQGKVVPGFTFKKAGGDIVIPPQHIRINTKDYITIAESTGKLNILSRTGKSRIDVSKNINFGETHFWVDRNQFNTYDINGNKITISAAGKVITAPTSLNANSRISQTKNTTAFLTENILTINSKTYELPYGDYTSPLVFRAGKKEFITTTNKESQEVYIFNTTGEILERFPVYGTSKANIGELQRNKSLGFVTQGDASTILIYRIN